jgi:hypothetical protein
MIIGLWLLSPWTVACRKASAPGQTPAFVEAYYQTTETRLKGFEAKIAQLQTKAAVSTRHTPGEVHEAITELNEKKTAAWLRFDELKAAPGKGWGEAKIHMDAALDDLDKTYQTAASKLN